ncbi:MAG: hypothetical protein ACXABY_10405 [Candidatus Thorarchaeota archaeon]
MDFFAHKPTAAPTDTEEEQFPGAAVMRGAGKVDQREPSEKAQRLLKIMQRKAAKDDTGEPQQRSGDLRSIMRGGVPEKPIKVEKTLGFTDQLFRETIATTLTVADFAANSTLATASGLYGLGRLVLGDDPDDVAKKMAKWHIDVAGSMKGAEDIGEREARNMQIADKVFGAFRPIAESFGNSP